ARAGERRCAVAARLRRLGGGVERAGGGGGAGTIRSAATSEPHGGRCKRAAGLRRSHFAVAATNSRKNRPLLLHAVSDAFARGW
ncbi:unnamed protein product, partial [Ectocarpus fasciculatus]